MPKDNIDAVYNELSEIVPPRADVAEKDDDLEDNYMGTMTQRMKVSPKMSDTQVVDKRLFPILREATEWLNHLMVARVSPETYLPMRNIIVKDLLRVYKELRVAEAIVIAETAISIAIDGEGRMDIIHMFSKLSEKTEEEKGKI